MSAQSLLVFCSRLKTRSFSRSFRWLYCRACKVTLVIMDTLIVVLTYLLNHGSDYILVTLTCDLWPWVDTDSHIQVCGPIEHSWIVTVTAYLSSATALPTALDQLWNNHSQTTVWKHHFVIGPVCQSVCLSDICTTTQPQHTWPSVIFCRRSYRLEFTSGRASRSRLYRKHFQTVTEELKTYLFAQH